MTDGAAIAANTVKALGYGTAWVYPGGTVSAFLAALDRAGIRVLVAANEAGAGHAAQGAYRVTGKPQLVVVTSGPGVTNVVTPVADAYYDGDALLVVAGQVAQSYLDEDRRVRQRGFQETDTLGILKPVTKAVYHAYPSNLCELLRRGTELATLRRVGPVLIQVPVDVWDAETPNDGGTWVLPTPIPRYLVDGRVVAKVKELLGVAERPVLLVGRGATGAEVQVRALMDRYPRLVAVSSLPGVGVIPSTARRYAGMIGHTGTREANYTLARAEEILAVGTRLDVRQTGSEVHQFIGKSVFLVTNDHLGALHCRIPGVVATLADAGEFLTEVLK